MVRFWLWVAAVVLIVLDVPTIAARHAHAALVITEVYVDPLGAGDIDEFIEIANTGPSAVDLGTYAIGTNDNPGVSSEPMRMFPTAQLAAGAVAVVARDGGQLATLWPDIPAGTLVFAFSSASAGQQALGTNIPGGWGSGNALALTNSGNEVLLAHNEGGGVWSLVDGVSWGTSTVISMTPLGGVATQFIDAALSTSGGIEGQSFARKSANIDTNLRADWRRITPATPGRAPFSICGDGVVGEGETCDDGLELGGDGCSALCQIECGFTCAGAGPGSCATDCGDGDVAGEEACDDGGNMPGDGCSPGCAVEPGFVCDTPAPMCDDDSDTLSHCVIDSCTLPLRITEVHVDGLLDNDSEWIELTNAGNLPIDLTAWTVTDQPTSGAAGEGAATFPAGSTLAAGATIVLAYNSEVLGTDFGVGAAFEYGSDSDPGVPQLVASAWAPGGPTLRLANDDDQVLLVCRAVVADRVQWGATPGTTVLPAPGPEYDAANPTRGPTTFERVAPELDSGNASDFVVSSCPTPGVAQNPNHAPDAGPALVVVPAGVTSTIYLPGDDPDGDALTFSITTTGILGSATLGSLGVVQYTPPAGPGPFTTAFTYRVADQCNRSAPATVQVLVQAASCASGLGSVKLNELHVDAKDDNAGEWIEIVNNGATSVSLAFLRIGDEESPGGNEGMFVFPAGATLAAGDVAVIAFSAAAFMLDWGFAPDYEWNRDSNGLADDLPRASTWARGTMRLDNTSDEVLLIGCDGAVLDAVYWGAPGVGQTPVEPPWAARLPAPPAFPGAPGAGPTTFERRAPDLDSNSAADWALQACPSPGSAAPEDEAPVADDGRFAVTTSLTATLPGSDADLDPLTFSVTTPTTGILSLLDASTGSFSYTPPGGFVGLVTFSYSVSDGCRSDGGTVTLCVGTSEIVGNDVDEDCNASVLCYVDADGDHYGTSATVSAPIGTGACLAAGRAAVAGDCDDDLGACGAACHPGAREDCNDRNDDCDAGTVDGSADPQLGSACDSNDLDKCLDDVRACSGGALVCNDVAATRAEVCDALDVDEDCDGGADDADPQGTPAGAPTFYRDRDGDGFGDAALSEVRCSPSSGYVSVAGDCADDPLGCGSACNPNITESRATGNCADGFDNDCDGPADQDAACFSDVTCHADADADGFGATAVTITLSGSAAGLGCAAYADGSHPAGYWVVDGTDCDDDPAACGAACHPGLPELCDGKNNDCNAATSDASGDVAVGAACDSSADADACEDEIGVCTAGVFSCPNITTGDSGRVEICDPQNIDEDCDGGADDLDPQGTPVSGTRTFYRDDDGDGRGRDGVSLVRCDAPSGYAPLGGDCDDNPAACGAACSPARVESKGSGNCSDSRDNDCDSATDTDAECFGDVFCYLDRDADGFGAVASEHLVTGPAADLGCAGYDDGTHPVGSWVGNGLDCDDDPAACGAACNPDRDDVCDAKDNDCSAATADGADDVRVGVACDANGDTDVCTDDRQSCQAGVVLCVNITTGDSGRVEHCDALHADDDCDGGGDDADPQGSPADAPTWYRDGDQDGFGLASSAVQRCVAPVGYIALAGDCEDDPTGCGVKCHPGLAELCDGYDNDCLAGTLDGAADPDVGVACDAPTDQDKCLDEVSICQGAITCPNDADGDLLRIEVCDDGNLDEDCDGGADDDDPEGAGGGSIFHRDLDGDGHGHPDGLVSACHAGPGRVTSADDCDDDPAACGADCAPDVSEAPAASNCDDGFDNDCDGTTDSDEACVSDTTCYADADGDGFGNDLAKIALPVGQAACASYDDHVHPVGYWVERGGDCAPADRDVSPDASEVVGDDVDDDCNGGLACWVDADDDGFARDGAAAADAAAGVSCDDAFGLAADQGDCDDDPLACGASCGPLGAERCDGFDNDCDGDTDEIAACTPVVEPDIEFVLDGGSGCGAGGGSQGGIVFGALLGLLGLVFVRRSRAHRRRKA